MVFATKAQKIQKGTTGFVVPFVLFSGYFLIDTQTL